MINIKLQKNIKKLMDKNIWRRNKGYTFLFAVLVSALVLAIGISILNISKKEFLLATSARDSSSAFYAADGGVECALYEDVYDRYTFQIDGTRAGGLNCVTEHSSPVSYIVITPDPLKKVEFKFDAKFGDPDGKSCASVKVTKTTIDAVNNIIKTEIDSRGYNSGWDGTNNRNKCDISSAKRVERAIHLSY